MAGLFFPVYRAGAHLLLRVLGCRGFWFRTGEVRLRCWRVGPEDGEPWVMLHGLGSIAASWAALLRDLRGDCRIVVPELSWLGGSDVPDGALAVRDGVEAAAALIQRQFPGRAVTVVGNSLGGWVALRLALERPELVSRLVLVGPGGYREQDWEHIEGLIRVSDLRDADRLLEAMFLRPPISQRILRHGFRAAFTSKAVRGALGKMTESDALSPEELARIEVPTALVWGEHDGIFSVEVAEHMAAALPRGTLYRVETAGHIVQWESPKSMVEAVRDFRRRSAGAPPAGPVRSSTGTPPPARGEVA
jgi:pimeloyl-ACP methyl ester carboxylesterase